MNSKESMNYSCFNFFIACDFMQFHFPLLHRSVCVKGSYRAITESSKLHLSNAGEPPFLKKKVAQESDTNEGCYRNDRPETHKIGNGYKVFFRSELACYYDALSSNGAISRTYFL